MSGRRQRGAARAGGKTAAGTATYPLLVGLAFTVTALLLVVRVATWPLPWFDEGLNLSTAAMLATEHSYGLPDSAGTRIMDPAIQTGPTVILPVTLAFKLFGVGILQARLTMVVFGLLAAVAYLLLARRLSGRAGALVALSLLVIGSGDLYTSFVPLSRQVLGEVPALGLFCVGAWLLARQIDSPSRTTYRAGLTIGAVFGLAMITKSQMALMLPAAIGLLWILNLVYYRAVDNRLPLVILGTSVSIVLGWYAAQMLIAGIETYQQNQAVLREGFAIHIARLSTSGPRAALGVLWSTGFIWWGMPGVLYGAYLARARGRAGLAQLLPLLLILLWLGWYVTLSIGWSRYAAVPLMLAPMYTGRLIVDLVAGRFPSAANHPPLRRLRLVAAAAILFGVGFSLVQTELRELVSKPNRDRQQIVSYLDRELSQSAVIETWAWELDPFVEQPLHHPPTSVTNDYTLAIWDGQPVAPDVYDLGIAAPTFILENAFSTWTGIYADHVEQRGELVAEFGQYRLYRLR